MLLLRRFLSLRKTFLSKNEGKMGRSLMRTCLLLFLFIIINPSNIAAFYDSFDDQASTLSNWSILAPEWTFTNLGETSGQIDYGFRGNHVTDNALAMVNSEVFDFSTLFISTNLNVQYREIDIGEQWPKDQGGSIYFAPEGFTDLFAEGVHTSLFYSHFSSQWYHLAGLGDEPDVDPLVVELPINGVDFDRDYNLTMRVDQSGTLYSTVYDDTGVALSTIALNSLPVQGQGSVGIYSDADAIFNNYTATAVPEPGTLLLLGTGLIGLIGLRRKLT